MPRRFNYHCTRCGYVPEGTESEAKAALTAKVIIFKGVGYGGRTLRSRVVEWLCSKCLIADPVWNTGDRTFLDQIAKDRA